MKIKYSLAINAKTFLMQKVVLKVMKHLYMKEIRSMSSVPLRILYKNHLNICFNHVQDLGLDLDELIYLDLDLLSNLKLPNLVLIQDKRRFMRGGVFSSPPIIVT